MPAAGRIRDATLADLDALMVLEHACYAPGIAFERDTYEANLHWARTVNLLVESPDGTRLDGFGGGVVLDDERTGEVYTLNVHPAARGHGLGRRLLDALEERFRARGCTRAQLEVNVENAPAMRLYESAGYARVERLPGYYEGTSYANEDAFRYAKDL